MGVITSKRPSEVFKKLSSVFLINSAAFSKASPAEQTAALTQNTGLPVLFVPSFASFSSARTIRDKLLSGVDVSTELEFNGIVLTDAEQRAVREFLPVLTKIGALKSGYPWVEEINISATIHCGVAAVHRGDYQVGIKTAENIWKRASKFWGGGSKAIPHSISAGSYSSRTVTYSNDDVKIGCQTVTRGELEAVAREYGWEPNCE